MTHSEADIEADIAPEDRGESVGLVEPLLVGGDAKERGALGDRALELAQRAAGLRRGLPESLLPPLATLVRSMNCYYSNLIEGHDTHPVDIERALRRDYSADPRKRDLQREAQAHIAVQSWIDSGALHGQALTAQGLRTTHARFCKALPDDLLWTTDKTSGRRARVHPGAWRTQDVVVGRHIAISPGAVPRFMDRLEQGYRGLGRTDTILAAACAHHRLLWVHPFTDGNGRVARLMSHAVLLEALDTGAVWSIARGLARNVETYKAHLAACDLPRRNDLDGRGHLSQEALAAFVAFFLETCIDQVTFMEGLMQPKTLQTRIRLWAEEATRLGTLPPKAAAVLDVLLYRGTLPRAEVAGIVDTGARQARRIVAALTDAGVVTADSSRAPLALAFPAALAHRWMPGLFPERPSQE